MTLIALFARYNEGVNRARIEYALTLERISREERRAALPKKPRIVGCGSRSGYTRHKRGGTPVCDPCLHAKRAYERERYRIRKGIQ